MTPWKFYKSRSLTNLLSSKSIYWNCESCEFTIELTDEGSSDPVTELDPPGYLLAYGPFPSSPDTTEWPESFVYRIYLYYTYVLIDEHFRIAYGNPLYYPIQFLHIEHEINNEIIANLTEEQVRLLVVASNVFALGHTQLNESVYLRDTYLSHAWPSPGAQTYGHNVYRYPIVEVILSLATFFIYQPHGDHARSFCRWHPQAAKIIFDSPNISPLRNDSDSSIYIPSTHLHQEKPSDLQS